MTIPRTLSEFVLLVSVLAACCLTIRTSAQEEPLIAEPIPAPNAEPLLAAVERAIADEQWLDAARAFQDAWLTLIQGEDEISRAPAGSAPVPPPDIGLTGGFRARLRSLYASAPNDFRIEYQRQFDAEARAALSAALDDRQFADLPALLSKYEHCDSAESAQRLLAAWNIQRGHFLDAALALRQIAEDIRQTHTSTQLLLAQAWARAGLIVEAHQVIARLANRIGYGAAVERNGEAIQLPSDPTGISAWLVERWPTLRDAALTWTMQGGNVRRVESQSIVDPSLKHLWTKSLFESAVRPEFNEVLRAFQDRISAGMTNVPIGPAESVVVGDHVIFTAAGTLQSVHRDTGTLLWESSLFNRQLGAALSLVDGPADYGPALIGRILLSAGRHHGRGQLAADGRTVFAVEETTQGVSSMLASASASSAENQQYNMLRAYDVSSGRLVAQAGGSAVQLDAERRDPLMGLYFLGAPLLLDERVFILAEDAQGISVFELRLTSSGRRVAAGPQRGVSGTSPAEQQFEIVQRQLLFTPRFDHSSHPVRRYAGLTPSFADGMLICQGCDGHIAGVDAMDLSIVWIHAYRSNVGMMDLGGQLPVLAGAITEDDSTRTDTLRRPHDSLARVAGESLLLMPRDSDQVICVDVRSGLGRWERPRGRLRYFGATRDDIVILAGGTQIHALRPADGSTVWSQELDNEMVSGQPAWTDRVTQIPTSGGYILSLDNQSGRNLLKNKVSDVPVGNLLGLPDRVLIQSHTELACWNAAETPDADSLASFRLALLSQNPDEAMAQLEAFVERTDGNSQQQRAARELLADQLLESLRLDYSGNRQVIPRLRELTGDESYSAEEVSDLIRHTLGMTPLDALQLPTVLNRMQASRNQQSRLERLIVQGLPQLRDLPPAELAKQMEPEISNVLRHGPRQMSNGRLTVLSSDLVAGAIARTLRELSEERHQQVVDKLTDTVVREWDAAGSELSPLDRLRFCRMAGLQRCLLAVPIPDSESDQQAVDSLARLQFLTSGRPGVPPTNDAWEQLRALWPKVIESPAVSESTLWPTTEQWQQQVSERQNDALGHLATWLRDQERSENSSTALVRPPVVDVGPARDGRAGRDPMIGAASNLIPILGAPGAFRGWQVMTLHAEPHIVAVDDRGRQQWEFQPTVPGQPLIRPNRLGAGGNDPNYAVACGYLLAIRYNQSLFMLDCSHIVDGQPRVLWSLQPGQLLDPPSRVQQFVRGWDRTTMYDRLPDGLAPLGPLTPYGLPLYQGRRLTVVDPWTGIPRWTVDDLPDDCRLAADDDTLCIISAAEGLIQVRDLRDGHLRRSGALPAWWTDANDLYDSSVLHIEREAGTRFPWRILVDGTRCVIFWMGHDEAELAAHELARPDEGTPPAWSVRLSANSVFSSVADGIVAVLSDDTELSLIRLTDGCVLAEHWVPPAVGCDRLYLRSSHDRLIVLTHCDDFTQEDAPVIGQTVPVNGPIYAVDTSDWSMAWAGETLHEFIRVVEPEKSPIPDAAPLLVLLKATLRRPENAAIVRELSARVLDVRSGDELHTEENPGRTLNYHGIRFEDDRTFRLMFDSRDVEFDFSGASQP